jgi:hypothetical protein
MRYYIAQKIAILIKFHWEASGLRLDIVWYTEKVSNDNQVVYS